jgi:hypothetical protein
MCGRPIEERVRERGKWERESGSVVILGDEGKNLKWCSSYSNGVIGYSVARAQAHRMHWPRLRTCLVGCTASAQPVSAGANQAFFGSFACMRREARRARFNRDRLTRARRPVRNPKTPNSISYFWEKKGKKVSTAPYSISPSPLMCKWLFSLSSQSLFSGGAWRRVQPKRNSITGPHWCIQKEF